MTCQCERKSCRIVCAMPGNDGDFTLLLSGKRLTTQETTISHSTIEIIYLVLTSLLSLQKSDGERRGERCDDLKADSGPYTMFHSNREYKSLTICILSTAVLSLILFD